MDKVGLLKDVSVIIMEWHYDNLQYLIDILSKNNFSIHCGTHGPHRLHEGDGMLIGEIIAFKK